VIRSRGAMIVVALFVAATTAACSDDTESAAPSTSGSRGSTTSRLSRDPVPPSTTMAPLATADDLHRCDRTLEPYSVYPPDGNVIVPPTLPALVGENLVVGGPVAFAGRWPTEWGDFDGDGTSDTLAWNEAGIFVVRGAVPDGAALADVGVRLEGTGPGPGFAVPVGDRDGDGADDVAFNGRIVSGRTLLSHGPGTSMPIPHEFATVPYLVTAVHLDPDGPPALARIFGRVGHPPTRTEPIEIKLEGTETTCLVTGNPNVDPALDGSFDSVTLTVTRVDGQRIVQYSYSGRNELLTYRWNLDAP
jgi:hypothetical protein